jgi:hypothetical protein
MKSKFLDKKLSLNKTTVANLNPAAMRFVKAGARLDVIGLHADVTEMEKAVKREVDSTYTYYTCPPWTCTCTDSCNCSEECK